MNRKSYVHQISEIGPREQVRLRASASTVASERRCVGVDWRCRESEGKAKIKGYMSVSDEEAHQRVHMPDHFIDVNSELDLDSRSLVVRRRLGPRYFMLV